MYCKLPTNGKQLPAFPLKAVTGIEPWPQRWEARVLPLCHRGPPCPLITPITQVKCKITHRTYPLTNIPPHKTCEISDIIYLITCRKCDKYYVGETGRPFRKRIYEHRLSVSKPKDSRITPVSKHFTEQGHSVKDMQFSLLEWCSLKYHEAITDHRKMREKWWMWNIAAIHPIGINQFI